MLNQIDNTSITIDSSTLPDLSGTYITTGVNSNYTYYSNNTLNSNSAVFDTDISIKGKSLLKTLDAIQSRLAILDDPSPEKLEKYVALKKAYEHYKLLEKLIGEENNEK